MVVELAISTSRNEHPTGQGDQLAGVSYIYIRSGIIVCRVSYLGETPTRVRLPLRRCVLSRRLSTIYRNRNRNRDRFVQFVGGT
jgi:hypothetical protein